MEQNKDTLPRDMAPHQWFIAVLADGSYRFITPYALQNAEKYIGEHGGGVYTHAGYLVMAANKQWWNFLTKKYDTENRNIPIGSRPPHIDVPNIECVFSPTALRWLEENMSLLQEKGGKYYDNIPKY